MASTLGGVVQTTPGIPTVPGFRLRHEIGKGGSGTVWSAVRTMDDRRFAVKIVPGSGGGPDAQALRELAVLTRVTSEHLVQLHATLPLPDGSLAMVLDLVDGGSFAEVVARGRPCWRRWPAPGGSRRPRGSGT